MQLFLKLFGPYRQWVYHGFDRIVINGHLLGLMRESQVVYFFRDVCGQPTSLPRHPGIVFGLSHKSAAFNVTSAPSEGRSCRKVGFRAHNGQRNAGLLQP